MNSNQSWVLFKSEIVKCKTDNSGLLSNYLFLEYKLNLRLGGNTTHLT